MRSCFQRAFPVLLLLVGSMLALPTTAAPTVTGETYLSLETTGPSPGNMALPSNGIPLDCSMWHELYPNYCVMHHQDYYWDNGDGVVSPCDYIVLDGICYHITWVGPTYYMSDVSGSGGVRVAEPVTSNAGESPVCEIWHEIYPNFCHEFHVDSWHDSNQNGQLDACDVIDAIFVPGAPPEYWHIDRIALNIKVVPGPTPVKPDTWGRLKTLYR